MTNTETKFVIGLIALIIVTVGLMYLDHKFFI